MRNNNNDEYNELEKLFHEAAIEAIEQETKHNQMLDELMMSIESVVAAASKEDKEEILQRLYALVIKHSTSLN